MARSTVDPATSPKSRDIKTSAKTPIVIAMDVTRSRGDDSKILYDKLPMLYGQIMMQNYVKEPALSFAAIGDIPCNDIGPVQVCDYAQGNDLDDWIKKLWLEEGGGGTGEESYEMMAYFYANHSTLECNKDNNKGFFFITGDESYYKLVNKDEVKKVIGDDIPESMSTQYVFKKLQQKYNVFFLMPKKSQEQRRQDIDAEISARLKREGAKSGDVAISLAWNTRDDLDLHVVTPRGEEISYNHKKSQCGGELDVDMNVNGESTSPVENVYWPVGGAPVGKYKVIVQNFKFHEHHHGTDVPFKVQVKVGDSVNIYKGNTKNTKVNVVVCEFDFVPQMKTESYDAYSDDVILGNWKKVIPADRILLLDDPKSIVDVILGVLSITSKSRDLAGYIKDMEARGQSETRTHQVKEILQKARLEDYTPPDDDEL